MALASFVGQGLKVRGGTNRFQQEIGLEAWIAGSFHFAFRLAKKGECGVALASHRFAEGFSNARWHERRIERVRVVKMLGRLYNAAPIIQPLAPLPRARTLASLPLRELS